MLGNAGLIQAPWFVCGKPCSFTCLCATWETGRRVVSVSTWALRPLCSVPPRLLRPPACDPEIDLLGDRGGYKQGCTGGSFVDEATHSWKIQTVQTAIKLFLSPAVSLCWPHSICHFTLMVVLSLYVVSWAALRFFSTDRGHKTRL